MDVACCVHQWGYFIDDPPNIQYVDGKREACGSRVSRFIKLVHVGHNGMRMHGRQTSPVVHGCFNLIGNDAMRVQHESTSVQRRKVVGCGIFYLHSIGACVCVACRIPLCVCYIPHPTQSVVCGLIDKSRKNNTTVIGACDSWKVQSGLSVH